MVTNLGEKKNYRKRHLRQPGHTKRHKRKDEIVLFQISQFFFGNADSNDLYNVAFKNYCNKLETISCSFHVQIPPNLVVKYTGQLRKP